MIKGKEILGVLVLLLTVAAQPNYQERAIYLSTRDNVCSFGEHSDNMQLIINTDGIDTYETEVEGATICSPYQVRPENIIVPGPFCIYINSTKGDYIDFEHETTKDIYRGVLLKIIQKTTVKNPVKLNKLSYNCVIFGDGTVQHFGTIFPDQTPAKIYLKCDKNTDQDQQKPIVA
jgi:hypothetical protein